VDGPSDSLARTKGGLALAAKFWPGLSDDVLRHHWTFNARGGQSAWKTPSGDGSILLAERDAWVTFYQETYRVLNVLPSGWLDGTSPFTRRMDELSDGPEAQARLQTEFRICRYFSN
jgi:hypothetical protein